ncbi:MAG: xylulokinase, partial [Phycisphaerales bacterium]|nr:xylulokinase [Phycisphaerales bacterium]
MGPVLGIDLGTHGAKALVLDVGAGRVLGRGGAPLSVDSPRPGAAEQDPDRWIDAVAHAVREALAAAGIDPASIAAVGVSGQQHGCVALDASDRPVRPAKLWCDTECADEAREFGARVGRPVPSGFTAPKLVWMKSREPANFARVRRVLLPHDWVNLFLTGDAFTDCGDASGTGYF